ncbi:MerE [Klebsiella pneumoniae]|nr:putative mercury resistance protein [Klebsiella pneumoniae]VUI24732.1 MerE [Klebsiella pneumoniae]
MNSPEHLPSETHKPITGYLWGALAVLTCPCHLPILALLQIVGGDKLIIPFC